MRWYLLLLAVMACAPSFDLEKYEKNRNRPAVVIQSTGYEVTASNGLELTLKRRNGDLSLKEIQKRLVLLLAPVKETLEIKEMSRGLPITLTKTDIENVWKLTTKALSSHANYGIYFQDPKSERLELIHTFLVKRGAPKLVSHDLSATDKKLTEEGRILFRFTFDQPIYLRDDQAISVVAREPKVYAPSVESLTVETDQHTVILRLAKNNSIFLVGQKYAFLFNPGLKNDEEESAIINPLEFEVIESGADLDELMAMAVSSSHSSVEIKWSLNQAHWTDLFMAEDRGPFSCLSRPCHLGKESVSFADEEALVHDDRFLFGGLTSRFQYNFVLRSEDARGRIMVARGTFKTREEETLRISEIMINPATKPGQKDQTGEFIEVANVSDSDVNLDNVHLSLEDIESKKTTSCELLEKPGKTVIAKGSHFLIVAHDFSKSLYGLDDGVTVVKLKQKTICGGLSNLRKKVIKLHRGDGHFIDSYGGHSWFAKEGQSVQRIDLMGLDDESNYCYTSLLQGPTPGRQNGPCG